MNKKLRKEIENLRFAISWLEPPFVGERTPVNELWYRIKLCLEDARRATPAPMEKT
jgi:hypothetical protein